jgi:hypothetical protein
VRKFGRVKMREDMGVSGSKFQISGFRAAVLLFFNSNPETET